MRTVQRSTPASAPLHTSSLPANVVATMSPPACARHLGSDTIRAWVASLPAGMPGVPLGMVRVLPSSSPSTHARLATSSRLYAHLACSPGARIRACGPKSLSSSLPQSSPSAAAASRHARHTPAAAAAARAPASASAPRSTAAGRPAHSGVPTGAAARRGSIARHRPAGPGRGVAAGRAGSAGPACAARRRGSRAHLSARARKAPIPRSTRARSRESTQRAVPINHNSQHIHTRAISICNMQTDSTQSTSRMLVDGGSPSARARAWAGAGGPWRANQQRRLASHGEMSCCVWHLRPPGKYRHIRARAD